MLSITPDAIDVRLIFGSSADNPFIISQYPDDDLTTDVARASIMNIQLYAQSASNDHTPNISAFKLLPHI